MEVTLCVMRPSLDQRYMHSMIYEIPDATAIAGPPPLSHFP